MRSESSIKKARQGDIVMTARSYYVLCMSYLLIPLLIFCIGYLKLYIGIPMALAFAGLFVFAAKGSGYKKSISREFIRLPLKYVIICALIAIGLSFITGIGEFVYALEDHAYRRAILRDLIDYQIGRAHV